MVASQSAFISLPGELQNAVFEHLDYRSAIMLASTCKHFHRILDPTTLVADHVKVINLEYLEGVPQHAGDKGFACFKCWKIKPRKDFAEKHVTGKRGKGNVNSYRRFCSQECGVGKNIYKPGNSVRMTDGKLYWKCCRCVELKDGMFCEYCTLCQDCLHLPARHTGDSCPRCNQRRMAGERRVRPAVQAGRRLGYPNYVSASITASVQTIKDPG